MAIQRSQSWSQTLLGLTALLGGLSACAKIVGIEDTTVTRVEGSAGNPSSSAGTAGVTPGNGGSSAAGAATAGAQTGGASGAAAGGGLLNQAGGADKAGSGGSPGSSECPCSAPTPTCENGKCVVRGPTMAKATSYYVDSTEVSKAHYDVFLSAKGSDTSGQIDECAWNKSYTPDGTVVDAPRPIVNVDWCDAAAYCSWADKRLCGAIGGGAVATADAANSTKAQMYLACAGPEDELYPYGGFTLQPDYCNEYFSGYMADVGKFDKCEGHYTGIFDLVGNAAEWIDSCDTAGGTDRSLDNCQLGGGSFLKDQYTCQTYTTSPRNKGANVFGFRCCSK
ncbi:MAG TPA: SUMF1/EgtB/PvdO family nonheme iron enzyme [Polyangiaceae bacterium]|nr:SUMF1/EgtB/PvdO family nonheme iron enzyme [Polyangiaceae bacterium]